MAWFDVGAGLAEAGKTVAQVASSALLEQQKSDLDKERLTLANELATERESKGRKEAHGYDMEKQASQQTFLSGESALNRASEEKRTAMSAGASIESARIHAKSVADQIAAMAPERDARTAQIKIENEAKNMVLGARTELQEATTAGDPDAINRAKARLSAAEFSASDETKLVLQHGNAVKVLKEDVDKTENTLAMLTAKGAELKSKMVIDKEDPGLKSAYDQMEAQRAQLEKTLKAQRSEYALQQRKLFSMLDDIANRSRGGGKKPERSLGDIIPKPQPTIEATPAVPGENY